MIKKLIVTDLPLFIIFPSQVAIKFVRKHSVKEFKEVSLRT